MDTPACQRNLNLRKKLAAAMGIDFKDKGHKVLFRTKVANYFEEHQLPLDKKFHDLDRATMAKRLAYCTAHTMNAWAIVHTSRKFPPSHAFPRVLFFPRHHTKIRDHTRKFSMTQHLSHRCETPSDENVLSRIYCKPGEGIRSRSFSTRSLAHSPASRHRGLHLE
jgi:hypothetical protein